MNELIEKLKTEAGLNEDQAGKAIAAISEYIKGKLPPMMHPMIDNFLSSSTTSTDEPDFMG